MVIASAIVVEDDDFLRALITNALETAGIKVLGSLKTAASALGIARQDQIEVAVLDLYLGPGPTGLDIAQALRKVDPLVGLVFLTSFSDPRLLDPDIKLPNGAVLLTKSKVSSLKQLVIAVLQAKNFPLGTKTLEASTLELSQHQIQIWRLIGLGLKNGEIAARLRVSEKAVEHVIGRLIAILQLGGENKLNPRVQLVREFSIRAGQLLREPL
jgi:DNA-binding NarL/FixJ family response regulator